MLNSSSNFIALLTKSMDDIEDAKDDNTINTIIENLLMKFTDSDFVTLYLFDSTKQRLYTKKDNSGVSMIDAKGFIGNAFLTKKPAFYNHIASDKNYFPEMDNPNNLRLKSQLIVPIVKNDRLLAIVRCSRSFQYNKPYTQKELELVSSVDTFLIKTIHRLTPHKNTEYTTKDKLLKVNSSAKNIAIDMPAVEKKITKVAESSKNTDINSTMLFLSNTVHDIRTPANSLYGFLELLEEQIEDKRLKVFVENAKESAKFINTLTDSILEQTKVSHEIQTSKPTIVTSVKFFAQAANIFSANMLDKNIYYLIHIDPTIPKQIKIDELKLKRIIINLIGNAYKFTPTEKHIDFKVKFNKKSKKLKISVADDGIGIDESQQKDIFKAFKQAEEDTSIHFGGTGLGLAISAKYVSNLGGELKLKSTLDKGSKFHFTIPIEIINSEPSYEKFYNLNKKITILTDHEYGLNANNIQNYLIELGMPTEKITITNKLDNDTTHLFCTQHKITPKVLKQAKEKNMKILLIEEKLFSMSKDNFYSTFDIVSENTYYGDLIHSTVFSGSKTKILIADDNKINIMLLESMLETEFVDITSVLDGEKTLETLKMAHENNNPFDIVFLDKHMPILSGTEVMNEFRDFEKVQKLQPIFAISITGDPHLSAGEKDLYDLLVNKPFNKDKVRDAIRLSIASDKKAKKTVEKKPFYKKVFS